jgi:glycosyltransferase involved in cell wall biosynthesis
MSGFDVFTLTSREDPFPLAMLEAAGLGVPVVSFATSGAVEFAGSGGGDPLAEVVPYLDVPAMVGAVIRLLDDACARRALGERGREHVLATHVTEVAAPRLFETLASLEPGLRERWIAP